MSSDRALCFHAIDFMGSVPVYSCIPIVSTGSSNINLRTDTSPKKPPNVLSTALFSQRLGMITISSSTANDSVFEKKPSRSPQEMYAPLRKKRPRLVN